MRLRPPRPEDFRSPAHTPAVAARIGLWLGVAFTVCFLTGLLSHAAQHPPGWFTWPTRPVSLYRITQGAHVISGVAAIPLLLAKLWSVYPRLFIRPPSRPPGRAVAHGAERLSILVLLCAAFFELASGLFNAVQSYPWRFFFVETHYAAGWIAAGALAVHIGVKLPRIGGGLGERPDPRRRAFLRIAWLSTGAAVLATAGGTVPWLSRVSVLAWRSPGGPQGLPVNRTAAAAGIQVPANWRLAITWPGGTAELTLDELATLRQRTATLPIACVEGWSATATWTGVPVPDLLAAVGAPTRRAIRVSSLEQSGLYATSLLPPAHTADPLTLLALRVNGEVLSADHGFPCRIIAPSRPGVLQTKWVTRLEVLA
ncbi:molybdopterin-dependent oxidoreductase [Micromonospora sp. CPCC 205371]|nr:molybdopterin-dependent oxidoreductase [Micromonospora sp. CPCC 205371]